MQVSIPIRVKLVGLVALTVSVSLASTIYVGSSLFISDKTSYIYDHNAGRLREVGRAIDAQVEKAATLGKAMAGVSSQTPVLSLEPFPMPSPVPDLTAAGLARLFEEARSGAGVQAMILYRPDVAQQLAVSHEFGEMKDAVRASLSQLGWTLAGIQAKGLLVGSLIDGKLPVGTWGPDRQGNPVVALSWVTVDTKLGEDSKQFGLWLIDSAGRELALSAPSTETPTLDAPSMQNLKAKLSATSFGQGALDWNSGIDQYLVGYQRFASGSLMLVGLIRRETAFIAATQMTNRYLSLGVGILLVMLGLSFLLSQGLTRRLGQVWDATRRVSSGDFGFRINLGRGSKDEVSDLATSFNTMSEKISTLIKETAEKARMEKELETAQAVQGMFFPTEPFTRGQVSLAGRYLPASECAGDWWNYSVVNKTLYAVIGDVTGHGVASALVTAAVNGAFSIVSKQLDAHPRVVLPALLTALDEVVYSSAGGNSTMTFLAWSLDMETGEVTVVNASHCKPYIFRNRGPGVKREFEPIMGNAVPPLGDLRGAIAETTTLTLNPGDWLLGYTDGLLDCVNPEGQHLTKMSALRLFDRVITEPTTTSAIVASDLYLDRFVSYLGEAGKNRIDDVTLVVCGYKV